MRRAVSAVEVMLATLIIAIALVAVMNVSQTQQRGAFFEEYHVQAQWRAAALITALTVRDPVELERAVAPAGLDPAGAEVAVPSALLPAAGKLVMEWVPAATAGAPGTALAALEKAPKRAALFTDEAFIAREPAGASGSQLLWRYHARVTWTFPADARPHLYELERLVARPGVSHQLRVAWPAPTAGR